MEEVHNMLKGWLRNPLGEVAKKITKGSTPTTYGYKFLPSGINFIKIENVKNGKINLASITAFISEDAHNNQARSSLCPDDILFSIAGTIGETAIVEPKHLPANTNQAFAIISGTSNILYPKFLEYQLKSFVSQSIKGLARGGAMNNVSLENLKELSITIAPLNEQKRVVAKIEELFSELDKGIESLKTAREQLRVYRQAVFKYAFEGKLTARWHENNHDTIRLKNFISGNEVKSFPELPKEWLYTELGEVIEEPKYGTSKKCDYGIDGIGVLRIPNIVSGVVDSTDLKFASFDADEISTYGLIRGDILTIRSNGSVSIVGKCAMVREQDEKFLYAGYLIRLRPNRECISPEFLTYVLSSHLLRTQIEQKAKSTSGVNNINAGELKSLIIPICGIEEQEEVVKFLKEMLSIIDHFEETIEEELQKSEALRQSILKKAFSGKLVAQDPNDEPASVLLERIRAEKEVQNTESKKSKAKRNAA